MLATSHIAGASILILLLSAAIWPAALGQTPEHSLSAAETERLATEVDETWKSIEALLERYATARGDERLVLDVQIEREADEFRLRLRPLIESINALEDAGRSVAGPRQVAESALGAARELTFDELRNLQGRIAELASRRAVSTGDGLLALERELTQASIELDSHIAAMFEIGGYESKLGLDVSSQTATWNAMLEERAAALASQIRITTARIAETSSAIASLEAGEGQSLDLHRLILDPPSTSDDD